MYIKEIALNNFRIYKHKHSLYFNPEKNKNVFIISGNNGYGKTTFLTALVWCLYGKQMKDVDDLYRTQINEAGGYSKFVQSCLNRLAQKEGEKDFSVSITFSDIDVPSITCEDIKIVRKGFFNRGTDDLEIYIDDHLNELTKEVGDEIFIQDFILPKEVAKFFFFDSEKIVSLAESKSIASKRQLSRAYSEVLGIKKYEDLKKNLQDLTLRFRKNSAKQTDRDKFDTLKSDIEKLENQILDSKINLDNFEDDKALLRKESDELQEKLIREGSALSIDEINDLKIDRYQLVKDIEVLKLDFKDLLELAPFAIAGGLFSEVKKHLEEEKSQTVLSNNQDILNLKAEKIIKAFNKLSLEENNIEVSQRAQQFYKDQLVELVNKHLKSESNNSTEESEIKTLHSFSEEEYNEFNSLFLQLRTSYASRVKDISKTLREKKLKYGKISRKLSNAESKETDGVIAKYREQKIEKDNGIKAIDNQISLLNQNLGAAQIEVTSKRKVREELAKKIKINERFIEKDNLAKRLIGELEDFIIKIKSEKKNALEKRILEGLKVLMHKKSFVKKVNVEVGEDIIDIILYNARKEEINKDTLSKGEQQLYATSILRALVEESNIEFPVFIDSPLQKFDALHAKNIISEFYPAISKQVVLFPLLEKEMTEEEYTHLKDKVKAAYIIYNEHEDMSSFLPVKPANLFNAAKKLKQNVF